MSVIIAETCPTAGALHLHRSTGTWAAVEMKLTRPVTPTGREKLELRKVSSLATLIPITRRPCIHKGEGGRIRRPGLECW
ncbi:hypothetical protein KC19_1G028500 [Ceratodon purpureus]|uniref:Uncharacterized protein n=1 Tax=Ceratodon purpureus TaxID=3225 RepID=A0A8T0J1Y7_CERPU|nr:hypothetical protein KC19_1G028500 [Ceratodon purpureus]